MASNDMNQVYVLPQLHTLLWSNKKVFNNYFINEKYFKCFEMIKFVLIGIMF